MLAPHILKILSQEDSAAGAMMMQIAIDDSGASCEFTACRSFLEAETLLNEFTFDILLTTFSRHHDESVQFIRTVRASHPRVVVIVLSASRDTAMAYEAGCHAFIRKPMEWTLFADNIKAILHFYGHVAELPSLEPNAASYASRLQSIRQSVGLVS